MNIADSPVLAGALDGLDQRLNDGLAQIDAQIDGKELELKQLRTERSAIVRLLRAIDPDSVPKQTRGPNAKPRSGVSSGYSLNVSAEKTDALEQWMREHPNADGWSGASIEKHDDFAKLPMSRATVNNALLKLVELGRARLDHTSPRTGAKHFKLTETKR